MSESGISGLTGAESTQLLALGTPAEIWDEVIEGPVTAREFQRVMLATLTGNTEVTDLGGGLTEVKYKSIDGTTTRYLVQHDNTGVRSVQILDGS